MLSLLNVTGGALRIWRRRLAGRKAAVPVEGCQGLLRLGVSGREDAVSGPAKEALRSLGDLLLAVESVRSSVPRGVKSQSHVVRALGGGPGLGGGPWDRGKWTRAVPWAASV